MNKGTILIELREFHSHEDIFAWWSDYWKTAVK